MYVVTTEVAPHVRVSRTLDRVAHFSREPRERRTLRRQLNKLAAKQAKAFDPTPRLVKPPTVQVIDLNEFKRSRPQADIVRVETVQPLISTFDKREAVAQEAGL